MRRRVVVIAAAALATAGVAGAASAALSLTFDRAAAAPGETVVARTAGKGAFARALRATVRRSPPRVFLVDPAEAEQVRSPADARLVELGRLRIDRRGNGRLEFVVPDVSRGEYTTLIYCRPCARYSDGRALLPAGQFEVVARR
jgi:hypothetical protein